MPTRVGPVAACPRELDPSFDLWHNVGGLVDTAAQVRKVHLFIPLTNCFDDERLGKGFLIRCPQQHGFRLVLRHRETCCFEDVHNDRHHLRIAFR